MILEAAMGMESAKMEEAAKSLALSDAESRKQMKTGKSKTNARLPPVGDNACAGRIVHGIPSVHASIFPQFKSKPLIPRFSAHAKFTKLFKTIFPNGLDGYREPAASPFVSRSLLTLDASLTAILEMAIFWNTHEQISKVVAEAHIRDWASLTPRPTIQSGYIETLDPPPPPAKVPLDLDTSDEVALRSLLLSIVHLVTKDFQTFHAFFQDAIDKQGDICVIAWICGVAMFRLAVVSLKEKETTGTEGDGWAEGR
ncbi:uncharacterized protein ARMOST_21540 [Armillaria ostoyae]|uniref:Uncharacterized protein n=1 Tax=Armillaria ostoyae TaxID=47428 RepID=A0A284SAG7_ARMOS|nr:uncharacterized protein ARMOST_21540 [Armillaria ostoyae]